MDKDDSFCIEEEGIIVVQSECNEDEFLTEQRSLEDVDILVNSPDLNSINVENYLKVDHFNNETNLSNQIIVHKSDGFMDESQFNELSVIDTNPGHLEQFENITIISRNLNVDVSETVIISDLEDENSGSTFQDRGQFSEVDLNEEADSDYDNENLFTKNLKEGRNIKKTLDSDTGQLKFVKKTSIKSFSTDYPLLSKKETSYKRRREKSILIDKNDPRVRLHFVKFLKKDGKTIKIWECGICSKEFIHQYTLMRHLPIHTDERNYRCNDCGKAFRQLSTLTQHKAIHSVQRPYVCDICHKTYSRVSTLLSHKKIHVKEKSHICPECGKGFHQRGNLKNHMYIHSNVRPYKCDLCGRGFNQASNLQCHKARAHSNGNITPACGDSKFKCSFCDELLSGRSSLRHHEHFIHGKKSFLASKNIPIDSSSDTNLALKRRKIGNSRIIQLPSTNHNLEKKMGLLIEPIDTKAMHKTLAAGVTPFALLKPVKNLPVVVKVQLCSSSKHMLVPASPAELRAAGKFSVLKQQDGKKSVQIKVPVVATIHQRIDDKGEFHMDVEPPSDEEIENEEEKQILPFVPAIVSSSVNSSNTTVTQHFVLNSSVVKGRVMKDSSAINDPEDMYLNVVNVPSDQVEYLLPSQDVCSVIEMSEQPESPDDLLAAAVNLVSQSSEKDNLEDCSSEIQYLRPTENYGEYEVVEPEEATHFASSEGVIEKIKPIITENVTMDPTHLSALMDALKNAGYELATTADSDEGTHQIILNSVDDTIIVENQNVTNIDVDDISNMPVNVDSEIVIKDETQE